MEVTDIAIAEKSQENANRNKSTGKIRQVSTSPNSAAIKATPQAPKNPFELVHKISPKTISSGDTRVSMIAW